ncbi:hypothetical protein BJY00DRAFT_305474 [Aspergillus carlsbadensis]|nr:hypothetical protein BJY00DRAFT_305474 [Aspergillus carlsbadensis]
MTLQPPFVSDFASWTTSSDEPTPLLPASARIRKTHVRYCPIDEPSRFVAADLSVKRLNRMHRWLWIAGLPLPPRPFTFQIAVAREIVIDERADMHLVWERTRRLHIKPLPQFLLAPQFWRDHICRDAYIYSIAIGFFHSYLSLIQHESDFVIARANHLVPDTLTWSSWVLLTQEALTNGPTESSPTTDAATDPQLNNISSPVNPRYTYGELRLSRLNLIYRLKHGYLYRGYEHEYQTYGELFTAYIAPLSVTTLYFVLALTAMQVGLATDFLQRSDAFQAVSWGFAVVSIVAPLVCIVVLGGVAFVIFVVSLWNALRWKRAAEGGTARPGARVLINLGH